MKMPAEIKGKNRLRDLRICDLYIHGLSPNEIYDVYRISKQPLTLRRIHQIIYTNAAFVNPKIGWTKSKRLHRLQRVAEKQSDHLSNRKDILDVIESIRVEVEGPKSGVTIHNDNSQHVTYVLADKLKAARERVNQSRLNASANATPSV